MPWSKNRPAPDQRGYDKAHRAMRARLLAELQRTGVGVCALGGEPIYPWMGSHLHLDHTPDRSGWRGLACAKHNLQDGARRGRARQASDRRVQTNNVTRLKW